MKSVLLFFICFVASFSIFCQVGIGTTTPNAILDVRSSNQSSPLGNDGILIPKVDDFPLINPAITQDGMMIYVTGLGTPTKGFYYWDHDISNWVGITGAKEINDLLDGRSDASGSSLYLGLGAGVFDDFTNNQNIGIGYLCLQFNTSGELNTAVGYNALRSSNGSENTAFGYGTLRQNISGIGNTSIGFNASRLNSTGSNNVAIGRSSLFNNTAGGGNVAIGVSSGGNVLGSNNTFIGAFSGQASSTLISSGNVFIGYAAGQMEANGNRLYIENSSSSSPLIYGEFDNDLVRINGSLDINNAYVFPNTDGSPNQVLTTDGAGMVSWGNLLPGVSSLIRDADADTKVDVEQTPNDDIIRFHARGQEHLTMYSTNDIFKFNIYNNNDNIIFGHNSGIQLLATAANNISLGTNSLELNLNGNNNLAFGTNALNKVTSDDNVAVGTNALGNATSGRNNVAVGSNAMLNNTLGQSNTVIGYAAGDNTFGSNNVFVGQQAGASATLQNTNNNVFIGYQAGLNLIANNRLHIESTNATIPLLGGDFNRNQVCINRDPSLLVNAFEVNGNASKSTPGSWLANSDSRLKKNINSISGTQALEVLSQIKGISYYWDDFKTGVDRPKSIQYGFTAQNIQEVLPERVTEDAYGFLQTAYGDYDAFFVEAIKELNRKLEEKNLKIKLLEEQILQVSEKIKELNSSN